MRESDAVRMRRSRDARRARLNRSLDRLAKLFPSGALKLATLPAEFFEEVAEEVERLRGGAQEPTAGTSKKCHCGRRFVASPDGERECEDCSRE